MSSAEERLLVVEDEKHLAEVIVDNLEIEGYQVALETNGERALEAIRNDPPGLVLLDVMLPGLDGFSICSKSCVASRRVSGRCSAASPRVTG